MRGPIFKILACLLAVSAAAMPTADAAQRTGVRKARVSRADADKAYSLDDIMREPKTYIQREVFFYCRFATTANLFKNVNTRFNANEHVNFAAWPDKTVLWDETGRKNLLPTLYVAKNNEEHLDVIRKLKKYELIAITGDVYNVYAGYPWIFVTKIEPVELPSDQINELVIEHMQSGNEALRADAGGAAARHFEQALQFGIPPEFRAKAYEQIAQAYLLDNRLDKAREYLRQATEANRKDTILNLALADLALKMDDPDEALAHSEFAKENSGRHPQVYGIIGEAYAMKCDFVKAFNNLNIASSTPGITPREKSMISVRRARIYSLSSRFPDAARVYAAVSEPGEPLSGEGWLHNEIGLFYERLYLETGDERYLDSAFSAYEEASRLSRMDASIFYNMAETEFRRQRLSEQPDFKLLKELIEKINQVQPDYPPTRIIEGRILFAEEKMEEAEYRYQAVASQIGDDPVSLMALAEAYIDLGRYMDAANTVRRARTLQPWNLRVKALGKFIEETAMAIAKAEADTRFEGWLNPPARGGSEACPPGSTLGARYNNRAQSRDGQYYARNREPRQAPSSDPRVAKGLARRPAAPVYDEQDAREYRREDGQRLARSRDDDRYERRDDLYGAPSRTVRVRPGEGVRVSSNGSSRAEPDEDIQAAARPAASPNGKNGGYPVTEVRLSGKARSEQGRNEPKPLNLGYKPGRGEMVESRETGESRQRGNENERDSVREEVKETRQFRIKERGGQEERRYEESRRDDRAAEPRYTSRSEPPRYDDRDDRGYGYESRDGGRYEREERYERAPRDDRDRRVDSRYDRDVRSRERSDDRYDRDERYESDSRSRRDSRYEADRYDRYDDRRDDGYDERYDGDYEAEYDSEGYLRFGQAAGSATAYGSLIVPENSEPMQQDEGGARVPKPFSFAPDTSPVIIAKVRAPGSGKREMPVRNANVFRPLNVSRQPAEIIEKEAVSPRNTGDTSVMAPPKSGAVKRTEVRLPSTARGVGMASDYSPAN